MRFVASLIGVILSILLIVYRDPVKRFTGNIDWAEQHLGAGGTYTLFLIVGVLGFLFSLTAMTGGFGLFFGDAF